MMTGRTLIFLIAATIITACGNTKAGKPMSVGEPYEVTIIAEDNNLAAITKAMLADTHEPMPQPECLYNVRTMKTINDVTRFMRILVVVRKNGKGIRVRYENDPYSRQQLMILLDVESSKRLREDSLNVAHTLQNTIGQFEMRNVAQQARHNINLALTKEIEKAVGCHIDIPKDFGASKTGKDFVWVSDNGTKTMCNICIYAVDGIHHSTDDILRIRDSVMAENIKGEKDGMVMATERRADIIANDNGHATTIRGLWQMTGDAMGGPFVSVTKADSTRRRTVTAEAFIYAPSEPKAKAMKRLEAILYTLRAD